MADEEKEETSEGKEGEEVPKEVKPSGSKLSLVLIIAVAVVVVVVTPLATWLVIKNMAPEPVVAVEKVGKSGEESILALKPITLNVAETHGTRILRIEVHLVISEKRLADELKEKSMALLVDRVILAAGRKTLDELEGQNGREALKREIIGEINSAIRSKAAGSVTDIYFNEFLIQ